MYGLFLDDERHPEDVTWIKYPANVNWVVVRNSKEFFDLFCNLVSTGEEFAVSFDHDIQQWCPIRGEVTGYTILKKMLNILQLDGLEFPMCYFHTQNPIGKENMECYYQNFIDFYNEELEK